jgi:hypothetical protein
MITIPSSCRASTVVELDLVADTFFASLDRFIDPGLIVRAGGITFYRRSRFTCFSPSSDTSGLSRDDVSGLSIDLGRVRRICLLSNGTLPPSFEVEFEGHGFALAIVPGLGKADEATIRSLTSGTTRAVGYETLQREGGGAWLDEGLASESEPWTNRLVFDRDTGTVSTAIRSAALAINARFHPALIDRDGSTLKLSDAAAENVLHFRAESGPDLPLAAPSPHSYHRHHFLP